MKSNHKRILALLMAFALVLQYSFSVSFLSVYAEGEGEQTEVTQSEAKAAADPAPAPEPEPVQAPPAEEPSAPAPEVSDSQSEEQNTEAAQDETVTSDDAAAEETAEETETVSEEGNSVSEETATEEAVSGEVVPEEEVAEEEAEEEDADEEEFPAVTLSKTVSGVTVTLKAPKGALPKGVKLSVKSVNRQDVFNAVDNKLEAEGKTLTDAVAFDVTPLDKDGHEIQPRKAVTVTFSGTGLSVGDGGVDVFRVSDDAGSVTEMGTSVATANKQQFSTSHFTIYVAGGSASDPNGDGSGPNTTNNRYVLEFGDKVTLTASETGTRNDEWSVTEGTGYVNFNRTTHVVTNNNGEKTQQEATILHRYRNWGWGAQWHSEEFYITLMPQKFDVIFMLQDVGESNFSEYDTQSVVKGTDATAPSLPDEKTDADGNICKFYGWCTDDSMQTEASLTNIQGKLTVYGKYTKTRTLTYKDNSPEGDAGTVPETAEYGVGNTVSIGSATMPGYGLSSWNAAPDGSGTTYNPGETISMPDEDLVLYAQWSKDLVNILYHRNYGIRDVILYIDPGIQTGNPVSVWTGSPTRENYVFRGWATSSSGNPVYYPGQTITVQPEMVDHGNVNLYAVWAPTKDVTVHGNSISITYDGLEHVLSSYFDGKKVTEIVNSDGYHEYDRIDFIIEWVAYFIDCTAIEAVGTDAGIYSTPVSGPLYTAVIEQLIKYIPDFDPFTFNQRYGTVVPGQLIIDPAELTVTTESAEKKYDGEALTAGGEITGLVNGETVTLTMTGSQTEAGESENTYELYWDGTANRHNYVLGEEELGTLKVYYEISYDANGGEGAPESTKAYSSSAELSETVPTLEGFSFLGWATSKEASEAEYQAGDSVSLDNNLELYAVWSAKQYTIKFVDEDGTLISEAEYPYGTSASEIKKPADPTKPADDKYTYTFAGWSPEIADVTEDATYTATYDKKEIKKSADITYNLGGGTYNGSTADIVEEHNVGDVIKIHEAPTKDGFVFVEWQGSSYQPGDSYTVEGDHTFTAIWEAANTDTEDEGTSDDSGKTDDGDKTDSSKGVKTGDDSGITGLLALMSVSAAGLIAMCFRRRREED